MAGVSLLLWMLAKQIFVFGGESMHRGRVGRGTDLVTKWYWEIHSVVSPMFPAHPGLGLECPGYLLTQPEVRPPKAELSLSGEMASFLKVAP